LWAALAGRNLLTKSQGEEAYEHFTASLDDPKLDVSRLVADTERSLDEIAAREHRLRLGAEVSGAVLMAATLAGLVANELSHQRQEDKNTWRLGLATFGFVMGGQLARALVPTPAERLLDLWRRDPGIKDLRLGIAPTAGGAMIGVSGDF
jgi:hypothetical protein